MRLLVTGGAGFIGSHFLRLVLRARPRWRIVNIDNLTYAGNRATIADIRSPRHTFVKGDICDTPLIERLLKAHRIDAIVNFAAESHVDRSIESAVPFLRSNVLGVESLLAAARRRGILRFVQISTDEVYGSASGDTAFSELDRLSPNNPYSASKAAADHLVRAYHVTHKLPACITRCTNNYGPYQFPEKFIPVVIASALADRPIPIYGDGKYRREWLHVSDHCTGILKVLEAGVVGEIYNISDDIDITNIEVAERILDLLGKPRSLVAHVTDRPGHDRCYRVDSRKCRRRLGWKPVVRFDHGLAETVAWYVKNRAWVTKVLGDA